MATVDDYLREFRLDISDDPEDVDDRIYTNNRLARFYASALKRYNRWAPQQLVISGAGPDAVVTPVPDEDDEHLLSLYWAQQVSQFERLEAARVGFSVSNVAGRVDGRERWRTARENTRDFQTEINRELARIRRRKSFGAAKFREQERRDSDPTSELT